MGLKDKIKGWLQGIIATLGEKVVAQLIEKHLTKENVINAIDAGLDVLENLAAKTSTKLDDKVLKKLRDGLNIPDND